jgi:hypothetical protein
VLIRFTIICYFQPKSALKPRPLPPRPSSAESTPQIRAAKVTDDSSSSSVASSKDDVSKSVGDTPQVGCARG